MNELAPGTVVRTVSEFTNGLARWFENQNAFRGAAISGEVSGLKETSGGHLSFTLKDRGAVLSCIVWQSKVRSLPPMQNGLAVIAIGNVRLRAEQSSYQMLVDAVQLTGIGELFAKFEALKEQFRLEGLFESQRKRRVPQFVRRVALISAAGSKASEDFLATIRAKAPFVRVEFLGTRVQGVGAEVEIREAFDKAQALDVDAIVLTRGGGSYEDLFTFNEEPVVRAIVRSRHPVITAIGHQEDHHLADDVADATYGTPSKAAEAIAQAWVSTHERIARAKRDLRAAVENALGRRSQRLALALSGLTGETRRIVQIAERRVAGYERTLATCNPSARLGARQNTLVSLRERLASARGRYFDERKHRVERAGLQLDRVDPGAPLARGYAIVSKGGTVVRDAKQIAPGDTVSARLGHGTFDARVETVRDE